MRKTRLFSSLLTLIIILSIVITGCSSSKESNSDTKGSNGSSSKGGTLIIARQSDAENLDPQFLDTINAASVVHNTIYEGLVQRDKNQEIKPLLATDWKQVNDVTWEFKLRKNVTFQDGTPFTANAVKKTFDRVLDPKVASPRAGVFKMVKEVKVVDDYTVQINLNEPFAPLLSVLANHEGGIISPKAIAKYGKKPIQNPDGTGPFKFNSRKPGQEIILVKNKDYWGKKPGINRVIYKVVPEDSTRISMVETGEAQIAEPLPVTEMDRVQSSTTMDIYRNEAFGTEFIGFNVKKKPFDNVQVRQAIAYAIEREAIIKGVYNNVGKIANSTMGSKVFGYDPDLKPFDYSITKAKKLLAEAGFPNGFTTTIWTMDNKERMNLAEVVQSQLKGISIDVKVKVLEYGSFIDAINKGEQDMFISSWRNATGDGDYNQFNVFHSSSQGPAGNNAFYSNSEVDKLIVAARRETNEMKRKELYSKAQEIETKEVPYIPIRVLENMVAISKNIEGFSMSPSGYLEINNITIK